MMTKQDVKGMLRLMGKRAEENDSILVERFRKNNVSKKDYLFVLTDERYDEKSCLTAIQSLISCEHAEPTVIGDFGYNFIQNAMYAGYSYTFVDNLIDYCGRVSKLNVNHKDEDGDTMLHTAIYADDFNGDIYEIYQTLIKYGFDSRLKDKAGRNIVEAMKYEKKTHNKFTSQAISKVEELYNKELDRLNASEIKETPLESLLATMGYDLHNNKEILKRELPKLNIKGDAYLLALTDELHNELSCFAALKSLIHFELNRVNQVDEVGYNFIQNAMYAGYSTEFINGCIDAAADDGFVTHKLEINHQDEDGDTMLHTAIYCNDECVLDIVSIYKNLLKHGFDSSIKDKQGRSIVDAMKSEKQRCNKFSDEQIKEIQKIYNEVLKIEDTGFTKEELEKNKKLGKEGLANFLKKCNR